MGFVCGVEVYPALKSKKESIVLKRGWMGATLRAYLCRECRIVLSSYTPDNGWFSGQETWAVEDGGEKG